MSREATDDDPLLQSIATLRTDVNRLIDEQLARLSALEPKRTTEPVAERRFSPPPQAYQAAPRSSRAQATSRVREPVEPPAPAKSESDDPSQRLDALARHLDGRLRRSGNRAKSAQGDAAERSEPGTDNKNGPAREARR